eukprot:7236734-Alexandrium_andersonii.AAC.1
MAVISPLVKAYREVLTDREASDNNVGDRPAACVCIVINEAAAKLVIEAAQGGLLAYYQQGTTNIVARLLLLGDQQLR